MTLWKLVYRTKFKAEEALISTDNKDFERAMLVAKAWLSLEPSHRFVSLARLTVADETILPPALRGPLQPAVREAQPEPAPEQPPAGGEPK